MLSPFLGYSSSTVQHSYLSTNQEIQIADLNLRSAGSNCKTKKKNRSAK